MVTVGWPTKPLSRRKAEAYAKSHEKKALAFFTIAILNDDAKALDDALYHESQAEYYRAQLPKQH